MLTLIPGAPPEPPTLDQRPYQPRGGALTLFTAHDPEVVVEGPANTGKSRAALEKLHFCATKYAGMRGLIVRQTRESCTESVLVTFETKVVPPGHPILAGPDRANRQRYTYPNGSEIVVAGLVAHSKDNRAKVMSTEYDLIYAAEATEISEDDAEKLTTRLRNKVMPYQQLILDVNPSAPTHWINQRANRGQTRRILSRHSDNPTFSAADQDRLDRLTGVRRDRLRDGRWAAADGLVYDTWDPAVHLVDTDQLVAWGLLTPDTLRPAPGIPATGAVDWGFTNPGVIQVWLTDSDGRLVLVWERVAVGKTIDWWVEQARAVQATYGVTLFVCDPAGASFIEQFTQAGLPAAAATNDIALGVQRVQERLTVAGDARPRLYARQDALTTRDPVLTDRKAPQGWAEEIEAYCWPTAGDGKPQKEAPVKKDDHSMDTGRYLVAYFDCQATLKWW